MASIISTSSISSLALLAVVLYILNILRTRFLSGLRELPGPRMAAYSRLWNVKNAASGEAHNSFRELHKKYGSVVRTGPYHVAIADPALIPVLYGTNNKFLKSNFYRFFDVSYEDRPMSSMFSTTNPATHKSLKQAVSNKFSLSSLKEFEPQVDQCTNMFVSIMEEYADSGEVVDLGVWLQWYAFDVIGAITFNRRFGFMEGRKDVENIIAGIEGGLWYGSIVGQVPEFHQWLLGNRTLEKVLSHIPAVSATNPIPKVVKMCEDAIREYDSEDVEASQKDFLAWFRKEAEKSPDRMSKHDLMNHLTNNLLAGSDTTAISLRAIFYYLVKNPACLAKLCQEIGTAEIEGRASKNMTIAEAMKLPYLQACMKEAMRLHPSVGYPLERFVPSEGLQIGDVNLPAGTIVGMNAWVIHHDKSIYGEDADEFKPERWIDASSDKLRYMEKCFLSFGAGTRTCIGKYISLMEMGKLVPQVLRRFDISWAAPDEEWKITTFWFAKQTGIKVRFHRKIGTEIGKVA